LAQFSVSPSWKSWTKARRLPLLFLRRPVLSSSMSKKATFWTLSSMWMSSPTNLMSLTRDCLGF